LAVKSREDRELEGEEDEDDGGEREKIRKRLTVWADGSQGSVLGSVRRARRRRECVFFSSIPLPLDRFGGGHGANAPADSEIS
jgi:hypothetical protein